MPEFVVQYGGLSRHLRGDERIRLRNRDDNLRNTSVDTTLVVGYHSGEAARCSNNTSRTSDARLFVRVRSML